jgi:hypothetical protein
MLWIRIRIQDSQMNAVGALFILTLVRRCVEQCSGSEFFSEIKIRVRIQQGKNDPQEKTMIVYIFEVVVVLFGGLETFHMQLENTSWRRKEKNFAISIF